MIATLILMANLPTYPGAVAKKFGDSQVKEVTTYWVDQPVERVMSWYAKRLRKSARLQTDEELLTYVVALKERRIGRNPTTPVILIKGVVIWGERGGSTYIALVDRAIPGGSLQPQNGQRDLGFGPDARVKKAVGADPNRYQDAQLGGRSTKGRSVRGSFP